MSRFWAGDDSGSSSAESDSGSESEQEKKVQTNRWAAVSDSDSSDEGERVVRSAKDKAWDGMKAVVSKISNARKINDWHEMQTPVWKSTSASGAPDNSSLSHFSAMTRPCRLRRAVANRHRHAIEQASRRWRGGRREDSARTRRILISTQVRGDIDVHGAAAPGRRERAPLLPGREPPLPQPAEQPRLAPRGPLLDQEAHGVNASRP